jgi:hypothetical protein
MKITSKDIESSKQNRDKFNKYYNDAVIDVITLKDECKMTIEQIKSATPYDIDFILHVFENYIIDWRNKNENDDNEKEYHLSVKINKYHKNIEQLTEKYGKSLLDEVLKEEVKENYYSSK